MYFASILGIISCLQVFPPHFEDLKSWALVLIVQLYKTFNSDFNNTCFLFYNLNCRETDFIIYNLHAAYNYYIYICTSLIKPKQIVHLPARYSSVFSPKCHVIYFRARIYFNYYNFFVTFSLSMISGRLLRPFFLIKNVAVCAAKMVPKSSIKNSFSLHEIVFQVAFKI